MIEVVGISFSDKGAIYYFSPGKYKLFKNVTVIVDTENGLQFGWVKKENFTVSNIVLVNLLQVLTRNSERSSQPKSISPSHK